MPRSRYLGWLGDTLEEPVPLRRADGRFTSDLVVGYATGYGSAEIAPFVRSLRQASRARVALIVDESPALGGFLREHGVDTAPASAAGRWRPHVHMVRHKRCLQLLAAYPDAGRVLITDVRDVVFQGDPFAAGYPDDAADLVFYAESVDRPLGGQGPNGRWLSSLVGAPLARWFFGGTCVCAGTVMGRPEAVARALRLVLILAAIPPSSALQLVGVDQAALNLMANWRLVDAVVAPNFGRVATIGLTARPAVTAEDWVLNPDGSRSPIVHQYDRHPALREMVRRRWAPELVDAPRSRPRGLRGLGYRMRRSFYKRARELR